jgi:hypothetical protein
VRLLALAGMLIVVGVLDASCTTKPTSSGAGGIVSAEVSTTAANVMAVTSTKPTTSIENRKQPSSSTPQVLTTTTSLPVEYSNGPLQIAPDGMGNWQRL